VLRQFADELWTVEGPVVQFLGLFPYPTRMVVARLPGGGLWLWSPIALDERLDEELARLGTPRELVAPNRLHHLYLSQWVARHPEARLHGAPGLARKRRDLHFHAELGDEPDAAWAGEIDQVVFRGEPFLGEVAFFHRRSRTALVCDLVQRFTRGSIGGWREWLMRADGLVGPEGSAPRELRAIWWNRSAGRAARDTLLRWKPERAVVAHGECIDEDAGAVLARALAWLGPGGRADPTGR
jgi:hypothetical protein